VKDEYETLEKYLDKLEADQNALEAQLNVFLGELEKMNQGKLLLGGANQDNLTQRCRELNDRMARLDNEVEKIIDNQNQTTHNPNQIDPKHATLNVSLILNNYFQVLRNLEFEALAARKRLEAIYNRGSQTA